MIELHKQIEKLLIKIDGEFSLYDIVFYDKELKDIDFKGIKYVEIDLSELTFLDTNSSLYLNRFVKKLQNQDIKTTFACNSEIQKTLELSKKIFDEKVFIKKDNFLEKIGKDTYNKYLGFLSFIAFLGELFWIKIRYIANPKLIRYKEIAFEINESAIKALGIIALTSFLIGLVVAYQGAYQLKLYGANIFIVDMLGISIFRELSPLITAIVIAGRSGSAYTAQIGAMKITQELDAMKTMGFEPYAFLVLPRIIALMIAMPVLIFVSDMMGIFGGMLIANLDLGITSELFIARFSEAVSAKHFFIGILKGPFFAFLIASIGIYRGLMVKDDTQSIGFNTTKSVVESIFAVIVCDAIFSIIFTNLGL